MIVPTTTASPFTAAKGTTLSKFILYFVCAGQQKAAQLGYSPLPKNLVQFAFNAVNRIPGHVAPPPISPVRQPDDHGRLHGRRARPAAARRAEGRDSAARCDVERDAADQPQRDGNGGGTRPVRPAPIVGEGRQEERQDHGDDCARSG